jgi:hypothetical protein
VTEIAVARAAFAGFGVLRRKPWAPLVWSLLYVGVLTALVLLLGGAFILAIGKLMRASAEHAATPKVDEILGLFGSVVGGYFLMLFAFWIMGAVVNMAVVRSVLAPEASAFAYLRLGAAELWLLLANFILFIIYTLASTAVTIPMAIVIGVVVAEWRDAAPFVTLPLQLATWTVSIWLGLRFCMVAPLIFTDRKFRLFESWTYTKGRVWRLFQVGALTVLATVGIYVVMLAVGIGAGFTVVRDLVNSMTPEAFFSQTPQQAWRAVSPVVAVYVVLAWLGSVVLFPLVFAPWAEVYRQLKGDEIDATFS